MGGITAEEAARYALQRDTLYLVGAAVIGAILTTFGMQLAVNTHAPVVVTLLKLGIGAGVAIVGVSLQIAGGIGLVYKIVSDATT